ncbi:MAG: nucleotidyltransferase domain-containing protein [Deltaproteobacteria bacterium]|nr:nucleotidyltransferase domain-containing protein [Deltaproteobacteria bacterium]
MGTYLEQRREKARTRLKTLREKLKETDALLSDKACVYVTGSFGRHEAGTHSDLDLFIVGKPNHVRDHGGESPRRELTRLDEIRVKAALIDAARDLGFPDFSGDGEYLVHYTGLDLIKTLGRPDDDVRNTFTARLLLLLESQPLLGESTYNATIEDVVAAYWEDYETHGKNFRPAFLVNDILRLWRTFCVNYEAKTSKEPAEKKAKRKLKNYKLKHSRLQTCYSAIAFFLALYRNNDTVNPQDVVAMVKLTPTQRLEKLSTDFDKSLKAPVDTLISSYETFLKNTDKEGDEILGVFMDRKKSRKLSEEANDFGDHFADLLLRLGERNPLYRLLIV